MRSLRKGGGNQGDTGSAGEDLAARFLARSRGYALKVRNWRNPADRREEIDLVCRDGEVLVFVEVRTRSEDALVPGFFSIDGRKRRTLRRVIRAYLRLLRHRPRTFRLDVVEVELTAGEPVIRHYENVGLFSA